MESSYLILLAQDAYDVPFRGKDGQELEDGSDTVFRYVLCSICPVKLAKPAPDILRNSRGVSQPGLGLAGGDAGSGLSVPSL